MLAGMVKWLMRPKDLGAPHHAALIGVARLLDILRQLVSGYFGSGDRVGRLASFTILRANEARACPLGLLSASSLLTPAAIRPNERRESALRAAANAVSPATVTPGASPRAFSAAFSRSSASLSLRGLLSAMRVSVRSAYSKREADGSRPASRHRSIVPLRSPANASSFWIILLLV